MALFTYWFPASSTYLLISYVSSWISFRVYFFTLLICLFVLSRLHSFIHPLASLDQVTEPSKTTSQPEQQGIHSISDLPPPLIQLSTKVHKTHSPWHVSMADAGTGRTHVSAADAAPPPGAHTRHRQGSDSPGPLVGQALPQGPLWMVILVRNLFQDPRVHRGTHGIHNLPGGRWRTQNSSESRRLCL